MVISASCRKMEEARVLDFNESWADVGWRARQTPRAAKGISVVERSGKPCER